MIKFLKKVLNKKQHQKSYFIHIPKTAGTSFINILDACFDVTKIFPAQLWHEINEKIIVKKSDYDLIRGHFGGGSYHLLASATPDLLTILRHPQSLSVSTFHFIKREKNTAIHNLVNDTNMRLIDFLNNSETASKINNRMTRHLSFDLQKDPEAQELFLSKQSIKVVEKWIKTPKPITDKQRLKRAFKALNSCKWFGIQERFDESMQLFAYTFNLPPIGKSPLLNAHKPEQEISHECQKLINNYNKHDIVLYEYALNKFDENYNTMCEQLQKLENSNDIDYLLDISYQKNHIHQLQANIDYGFGMKLLGAHWHRRELTQPENSYFRWTNSPDAFIDFWMVKGNYDIEIRIINAVSIEHINQLDLSINGKSTQFKYDIDTGVVRILKASISKHQLQNGLLRIAFNHFQNQQHSKVFGGNDNRDLGIAINWIRINPC